MGGEKAGKEKCYGVALKGQNDQQLRRAIESRLRRDGLEICAEGNLREDEGPEWHGLPPPDQILICGKGTRQARVPFS
jgi:hypothetical protein